MIADAAVFVADKFKQAAADRLGPTVVWAGIIAVFSTAALAFALVAAYFYLAPIFGSLEAAALLAAACVAVVAAMVVVPGSIGAWPSCLRARRKKRAMR